MESEMKKHRYVDSKRRCVISLAVILTGCLIWGGCSVEEGRNADTGEESAAEKETVGVVFPVRGDPFASEATPKEENTGNGEAASKEENARDGEAATKEIDTDIDGDIPLLEQLFSYETCERFGESYMVITGVAEQYRDDFWENMSAVTRIRYKYMLIPDDINGVPVRGVSEEAFVGMDIQDLHLPANLEQIGAEAFAGCSLERLMLPDRPLVIGERAFADNEELWTVLIPDTQAILEEGVFENCRDEFLLCYGSNSKERVNLVAEYAREQGFDRMEIILSQEPIVNYPTEPLVLKPEIRNFFYGDYENYEDYEEELWCS
ncbi:MAG: leucine-rich repeat domain-containing protein, partial [Acetatifactor sp.]|nr:leucine-rich repeat domain-containing protein [Acetatifactor sp.]